VPRILATVPDGRWQEDWASSSIMMKSRPCGSMLGSVRPSLKPGDCIVPLNRLHTGLEPSAMALNWLAYLLFGL
jgi:hypothetical protein